MGEFKKREKKNNKKMQQIKPTAEKKSVYTFFVALFFIWLAEL